MFDPYTPTPYSQIVEAESEADDQAPDLRRPFVLVLGGSR